MLLSKFRLKRDSDGDFVATRKALHEVVGYFCETSVRRLMDDADPKFAEVELHTRMAKGRVRAEVTEKDAFGDIDILVGDYDSVQVNERTFKKLKIKNETGFVFYIQIKPVVAKKRKRATATA